MIKIDVVSGFLGAGKTTLVKRLLSACRHEKVVLIENEFGEIGIDGDLVERDGFDVFEISSGCICCIMKKDFVEVLQRIIDEYKPDRIMIEPTGISILSDIVEILKSPAFVNLCEINSLITVVDSVHFLDQREIFGEFFEDQIANASQLVLSKAQLVEEPQIVKVTEALRGMNEAAEIVAFSWGDMGDGQMERLIEGDVIADFNEMSHAEHRPCRENEFSTFASKSLGKFTETALELVLEELKQPRFGQVLRGKGFIRGVGTNLEFSYTNGSYMVSESKFKSSGKFCLIGKNLVDHEIKKIFGIKDEGVAKWLKF